MTIQSGLLGSVASQVLVAQQRKLNKGHTVDGVCVCVCICVFFRLYLLTFSLTPPQPAAPWVGKLDKADLPSTPLPCPPAQWGEGVTSAA